jgi:Recombination endonuclease VII
MGTQSKESKKQCMLARKHLGLCLDCPAKARPHRVLCQTCQDKQLKLQERYASQRPWVKAASHRLRVYGITPERYIDMLFDQNGRCGMCHQFFLESPDVDHDHETGEVRELLCHKCNTGLGYIDDVAFMDRAKAYVRRIESGRLQPCSSVNVAA